MNNMAKNMLLWLAIAAVLLSVFNNFNTQGQKEQLGYSAFIQEVQNNRLSKVVVDGLTISQSELMAPALRPFDQWSRTQNYG